MNLSKYLVLAATSAALAGCGSSASSPPAPHSGTHPAATHTMPAVGGCQQALPVFDRVSSKLSTMRGAASIPAATSAIAYSVAQLASLQASLQGTDPRLAAQVAAFTSDLRTVNTDLQQGAAGQERAGGPDSIKLNSAGDALVASCPSLRHDILGT
jgi:hypothetical protein